MQLVCKRCHYTCLSCVFVAFTPCEPAGGARLRCLTLIHCEAIGSISKIQKALFLILLKSVPILDFWGPYAKLCRGGGETFVRVSLRVESRSRKALEKQSLPRLVRFHLVFFFSQTRDCTTFMLHDLTDYYVERVTAHRIKINYHSCFHNSWPNSKKIKTSLRARGPLVFRGPYAACVFCV